MPIVSESRLNPPEVMWYNHVYQPTGVVNSGSVSFSNGRSSITGYRSGKRVPKELEEGDAVVDGVAELDGINAHKAKMKQVRSEQKAKYDTGHNVRFSGTSTNYSRSRGIVMSTIVSGRQRSYHGYMIPAMGTAPAWPTQIPETVEADIMAYGRVGISQTAPTAPEAGLAQVVGELRERLPALIGLQTYKQGLSPNTIGSEHLNIEFGVKPLIADIQRLAASVLSANALVGQYVKDSGNIVRRRRVLRDSHVASGPISYTGSPQWSQFGSLTTTNLGLTFGVPSYVDLTTRKTYFKGAYTYHLEEAHSFLGKMAQYEQKANLLLGSRITPELAWELTPWSWLIDWVSDVGVFVRNVTLLSSDSLVLRYGYIMDETKVVRTRTQTVHASKGTLHAGAERIAVSHTSYIRTRTRSTPYGFGLDTTKFSPRQWSILAALGMTKGPRTLRSSGD